MERLSKLDCSQKVFKASLRACRHPGSDMTPGSRRDLPPRFYRSRLRGPSRLLPPLSPQTAAGERGGRGTSPRNATGPFPCVTTPLRSPCCGPPGGRGRPPRPAPGPSGRTPRRDAPVPAAPRTDTALRAQHCLFSSSLLLSAPGPPPPPRHLAKSPAETKRPEAGEGPAAGAGDPAGAPLPPPRSPAWPSPPPRPLFLLSHRRRARR